MSWFAVSSLINPDLERRLNTQHCVRKKMQPPHFHLFQLLICEYLLVFSVICEIPQNTYIYLGKLFQGQIFSPFSEYKTINPEKTSQIYFWLTGQQ